MKELPMIALLAYFQKKLPEHCQSVEVSEKEHDVIRGFIRHSIIASVFSKKDKIRKRQTLKKA